MIFKYKRIFFVLALLPLCTYLGYIISTPNQIELFDKSSAAHISDLDLGSSVKSVIDAIERTKSSGSYKKSQDDVITETQLGSEFIVDEDHSTLVWPKENNERHNKNYKKIVDTEKDSHEIIHDKVHQIRIKHDLDQNNDKKDKLKGEDFSSPTVASTKKELPDQENHPTNKYEAKKVSITQLPDGKFHDPDETLSNENREFCPFELLNDDHGHDYSHIKPYFDSIRRDHFLINASPFGPNNQLRGFRDTIILAIYLNRTIVMPPVFKHRSDPSRNRPGYLYQDSTQKVDPLKLAEFVPVISLKQFSEKCKHGIDLQFLARETSAQNGWARVHKIEKATGIPITKSRTTKHDVKYFAPTVQNVNHKTFRRSKRQTFVQMSKESALQAYGPNVPNSNDGACALWNEPYRNVDFTGFLKVPEKIKTDVGEVDYVSPTEEAMDPREIASRTMIHTPRASSVRNMAKEFVKNVMKAEDYVAMHWRYDPVDFGNHCRKTKYKEAACKKEMDPIAIGANLEKQITTFNSRTGQRLNKVFVASPPIMGDFIKKMAQGFKGDIQLFLGTDLDEYLEVRHEKCPNEVYVDRIHDYKSLIEMELCSKSAFFLPSSHSSWSSNINQERAVRKVQEYDVTNTHLLRTPKDK